MIRAIVFDFDGVLVESVDVKTQAFAELFKNEPPETLEKILEYHKTNGGISRFEKFRYFYNHLLHQSLSKEQEMLLGEEFSNLVVKSVIEAPWVPGAKETLESLYRELPLYVASGTPENELHRIMKARNMSYYFKGAYGTPEQKPSIIRKVISLHNITPDRLIMVGDAMSDYLAAKETGVRFIGRAEPGNNPFPDNGVQIIPDLINFNEII